MKIFIPNESGQPGYVMRLHKPKSAYDLEMVRDIRDEYCDGELVPYLSLASDLRIYETKGGCDFVYDCNKRRLFLFYPLGHVAEAVHHEVLED